MAKIFAKLGHDIEWVKKKKSVMEKQALEESNLIDKPDEEKSKEELINIKRNLKKIKKT